MHTDGPIDMYRFIQAPPLIKEVVPPRHRRKKRDDDVAINGQISQSQNLANPRGAQFDLVEEAFPPLPGNFFTHQN